jgi:WD40 repeat protein/uncharacterized caspase-like protein
VPTGCHNALRTGRRALLAGLAVAAPCVALADTPQVFVQLGHSNTVHAVAFSPKGHLLASAGEDGATLLWDLSTQRELRALRASQQPVDALAFSPDGTRLVAGIHDGTLVIFEVGSGRVLRVLHAHTGAVLGVAFAADGRTIASAGADHSIGIWDAGSDQRVRELTGHRDAVTAVAFSADGRQLASASVDKTLKVWDVATGHELHAFAGHTQRVTGVAFCGPWLASSSWDHTAKLWDPAAGKELRTLSGHTSEVWGVACSADGHTVASAGYDHRIELWDAASGRALHELPGDARWVESVSFSPDGRWLASGGADHAVKVWDVSSGARLYTLEGHAAFVRSVAFSHNGKLLASGSADSAVRLWGTADGHELQTISPAHSNWVGAVAFVPNGHQVATRGGDQTVKIWDFMTRQSLHTLALGGAGGAGTALAVSADGRLLAAGAAGNAIKLFNPADGREVRTLSGSPAPIEAVAFAPDGQTLASGDERAGIRLWNPGTAQVLRTLAGAGSYVAAVAFSPDGRLLASGGGDHLVHLWDVATGRELRTLQGHAAAVTSIAFAPQGAVLASSDAGASVRLWDAASGKPLHTLQGHQDEVESVSFSPDGHLLASASADATIRVWDVATGAERVALIGFSDGSTLLITPQGYYDFDRDSAEENLNVRVGAEVSGIGAYRERFYRPDLVRKALGGVSLPQNLPTLQSVKPAPEVVLLDVPAETGAESLDLHFKVTDRGGGIGEVRAFVNGTAVTETAARALEVVPVGGTPARTLHLRLVPGNNDIRVVAFSADGSVSSNPVHAAVNAKYTISTQPQLYALVVGIQDYKNPRFDLKYSVSDATAIGELLKKRAASLYAKVNVEELTTAQTTTKTALTSALARYRGIAPADVFVFYVASHGAVTGGDANPEYFLISSNVDTATEEALKRDALGEVELRQLVGNIPATRKLLLLDTCHAGAMGDAMMLTTRNLEELAAVKVLSGGVGSTVLSASSSDEEALEGEGGHGLFTWVLLQGLGGDADLRKHGYVNTFELADYVDDEVPRLAEQHFKRRQEPNLHNAGQSFQIVSSR